MVKVDQKNPGMYEYQNIVHPYQCLFILSCHYTQAYLFFNVDDIVTIVGYNILCTYSLDLKVIR